MARVITVELAGNAKTHELIDSMIDGTADYTTPLERSGTYMSGVIGSRFRTGKSRWTDLHPATVRLQPRRAGGIPLNDTGTLKRSITNLRSQEIDSGKVMYYGSTLEYAAMHNWGGTGPGNFLPIPYSNIPQREYAYYTEENKDRIQEIFADYIKEVGE